MSVSFQYPSLYQCHFCFCNYFNYFRNNTFSLYPFFCRGLIFSFQSFLTSLITKAAVNRLRVAKNSHWFSVFSKSYVFVGTDLLVSFEHHQSALMDVHCIRGLMNSISLKIITNLKWKYQPLRIYQGKYKNINILVGH